MARPSRVTGSASTLALASLVMASLALVVSLAAYLRAGRLAAALIDAGTTLDVHLAAPESPPLHALPSPKALTQAAPPVSHPTTPTRSPLLGPNETLAKPIAPRRLDTPAPAPAPGQVLPWRQGPEHFGQTITVEGTVVSTKRFRSVTLLNFARDRQSFYIAVYASAFDAAPDSKPEQYFLNKTLRVTGQVGHHKGRPQIKVKQKDQIAVVQ